MSLTPLSTWVADVLREHMDDQHLSGYRLIKVTDLKETRVYRWLRGRYPIEIDELAIVAEVLEVPVTDIVAEAERRFRADVEAHDGDDKKPSEQEASEWEAWQAERRAPASRDDDAPDASSDRIEVDTVHDVSTKSLKASLLAVIEERRLARKLSGRTLATKAGLDINTAARKLRGTGDFSVDELEAVAAVLGLRGADALLRAARGRS